MAARRSRPTPSPGMRSAQSVDPKWIAEKAALDRGWRTQQYNNRLDAFVAGSFLIMVSAIVLLSLRDWILLLSRRKTAVLHESEPVWLPDYAVAEANGKFGGVAGTAALTLALAKELSGEAHLERAHAAQAHECKCDQPAGAAQKSPEQLYVETTEQRFTGVRRCC